MTALRRTNAAWLSELRDPGPRGARAQQDLRAIIVRGLRRGLATRPEASASIEDFAQESVLRVVERLEAFGDESRFTTWAIAVALRFAFNALRRQHWRDVSIEAFVEASPVQAARSASSEPSDTDAPSPERAIAQREIFAVLASCTAESLSERQRQVIIAELRGMPQAEIAAQLGSNRNAVYKLGHDARRTLQKSLLAAGYSADVVRWAFE